MTANHGEPAAQTEQRVSPGFLKSCRPGVFLQFLYGLLECWLFSRKNFVLILAMPFLLLTSSAALSVIWIRYSEKIDVIRQYEAVYNRAVTSGETPIADTCLRALAELEPGNYEYLMRLGTSMFERGEKQRGYQQILELAGEDELGFPEARMWLVRQSLQPGSEFKLSAEGFEKQLKKILDVNPGDGQANVLLGNYYIEVQEYQLAEEHLSKAALKLPEVNLQLAELKKRLNRPGEDSIRVAQRAVTQLTQQLEANRESVATRVRLSEAWRLSGDFTSAEEILRSGLSEEDSGSENSETDREQLRKALANFLLVEAQRQIALNRTNVDSVFRRVREAIPLDPGNPAIPRMLFVLGNLNVNFKPEYLQQVIDYWTEQVQQTSLDDEQQSVTLAVQCRLSLAQVYLSASDAKSAAEAMRELAEKQPQFRLTLGKLLVRAGNAGEGEAILTDIVARQNEILEEYKGDQAALSTLVEALLELKRPAEGRLLLREIVSELPTAATNREKTLLRLFRAACVMEFDQLTGYSSLGFDRIRSREALDFGPAAPEELMSLLNDGLLGPGVSLPVVERFSRLSLSFHPAAEAAASRLNELRMTGTDGVTALKKLGEHALRLEEYNLGMRWFEQANSISRGRDPVILNNLSLTIIRSKSPDFEKALLLINQALEKSPENGDLLATRGECFVKQENWEDALRDLVRAVQSRRDNPEIHRLLQATYNALSDVPMAQTHGRLAENLEFEQGLSE